MRAEQPRKVIGDNYDKLKLLRELEVIHGRINGIIITPAVALLENTKADYVAGDVGTAANIAAALNTVAAAVNNANAAINSILEKINAG